MGKSLAIARDICSRLFIIGALAALVWVFHSDQAHAQSPDTLPTASPQLGDSPKPPDDAFEDLARRASAAREQDRSGEAIDLHQKALALHPDWIEGWWYLGTLYAASDQNVQAAAAFRKVVDAKPDFGPGWASLGLAEYETRNYSDAYTALLRAQTLGFQAAPQLEKVANYHLALLLNQNGRFEDAWELLASTFANSEGFPGTKTALALAMLRVPLVPEQISPTKDALLDMAGETALTLVAGRFERASPLFQRLLREYPDTPYLHYAYGSALDFQQQYQEAQKQLEAQIRLTPRSAIAHIRLGAVLVKLHRPGDALPVARRAADLDPHSAIAHKLLARILTDLGRTQEATHETNLASQASAAASLVDRDVAEIYRAPVPAQQSTGKDAIAARTLTNEAAATFSDLVASAEKERASGHATEAIELYQHALQKNPTWAKGWTDLGVLFYASKHYSDSNTALVQSVALDRSQADAWVFLGLSEFEIKDYQNAFLHLEHGRRLGFHGTEEAKKIATYDLAQLRNLNGDFEGALDLMASALDANQLDHSIKLVMGMSLLRVPNLASQVDPVKTTMLEAVGETTAQLRQQKYDDAFRGFDKLLQTYPDTPFLHYAYGSALQTFSRFDEAERQYQEEVRITPQSALPLLRLALLALTLHHPESAVSYAQKATNLDPDSAGAHEVLGRALLDMGKIDDAVRELELAERLAPTYPEVHFELARAYSKAKMTAKAEQERAIFAEMSNVSEHESALRGSNAYGAPHDRSISEPQPPKVGSSPE